MLEETVLVLGGSFDPIHNAHLHIALESAKQVRASKVIFVPAHQSPLKDFAPNVSDSHRLAMLEIALEGFPIDYEICKFELEKNTISYTYDTVDFLLKQYKNIYWLIGSDQYEQLHKWKNIQLLAKLIKFALVIRPNYALKNKLLPANIRIKTIKSTQSEVSSTQIRQKLEQKDFLNVEISQKLVLYIRENKLYEK